MTKKYTLEDHVNDLLKTLFGDLGLQSQADYHIESSMSDYMKESLKGGAKTKNKTNFGKPDFSIEKYSIPIVIENKLSTKKLVRLKGQAVSNDEKAIQGYAVNGALHYAQTMINSKKYNEVLAIGFTADSAENIAFEVYFVFGSGEGGYKKIDVSHLNFLESTSTFGSFYSEIKLTEEEKHNILIDSKEKLSKYAQKLNKLMHNHNITAAQRVLYVSGMLLAMQDIVTEDNDTIKIGLVPDDLKGVNLDNHRDGILILNQIKAFLSTRGIEQTKCDLMLSSFNEIAKDPQRDIKSDLDKEVAKLIDGKASTNKQIFTFIFENIYCAIDNFGGHLDIMGELYSEFLKYALGDGKEIGIVLTPPYVTQMMAKILNTNQNSKVMDLATGSAGFLISSMELMIADCEENLGKDSESAKEKIAEIKKNQLLGVELNAEMYTLATTNMILRGDGSSNIQKANTFSTPPKLYKDFNADRLLLNPPFSYTENGIPFIKFGLENMQKGGLAAIIIQDSAGSGQATTSNRQILKNHTLIASIKMPIDLFQPMAGVQTSIYVFKVGTPHDTDTLVKFIDFRNDGYKRTKRTLQEIDNPTQRYQDIIKIYKAGTRAKVDNDLWEIEDIYIENFITLQGNDWNFDQHKIVDTKPTIDDFKKTVSDYLAWEVSNILKRQGDGLGK